MIARLAVLCAGLALAGLASAQVTVTDPWVRGTVPQQKSTGAFMTLKSAADVKLVGASSPVAGVVEVHEMSMANNVMTMRAAPSVDLPAGKAVELKPGGYHIMLMELKQPLKAGDTVPLTLTVEGKDRKTETIQVSATVRALGAPAPQAPNSSHSHGDHKH